MCLTKVSVPAVFGGREAPAAARGRLINKKSRLVSIRLKTYYQFLINFQSLCLNRTVSLVTFFLGLMHPLQELRYTYAVTNQVHSMLSRKYQSNVYKASIRA